MEIGRDSPLEEQAVPFEEQKQRLLYDDTREKSVSSGSRGEIEQKLKAPKQQQPQRRFETRVIKVREKRPETIRIMAKNMVTLYEYEALVKFDLNCIPKLEKWVSKKRFRCEESVTDDKILLKIDIFSFNLR